VKPPETPVSPGREQEALNEHIDRVTHHVTLERVRRLAQDLIREEQEKQRLLRVILITLALGALLAVALIFFYSL
jgi:hypothetical protein